jgi:hypothetical protein
MRGDTNNGALHRRDADARLWLPLHIARNAMGKVRPGGTLLFIGGTGVRPIGFTNSIALEIGHRHSLGSSAARIPIPM